MRWDSSVLEGRGRWWLHGLNALLIILTDLFLVLEGTSGPATGYWWMKVTYTHSLGTKTSAARIRQIAGSGQVQSGETWLIGALGACKDGERYVPCDVLVLPGEAHVPDAPLDSHLPVTTAL